MCSVRFEMREKSEAESVGLQVGSSCPLIGSYNNPHKA